jgi:hypothetical protein
VVGGPSFTSQLGIYDTDCPCTFEGGAGNGIAIGLNYDKNILTYGTATKGQLWLGARLMFETRNITARFRQFEEVQVPSLARPEQLFTTPIQFRHEAQIGVSMVTLTPYLQWNPFGRVFAQVGLQGGVVVASSVRHTKELLDRTTRLSNGERVEIELRDFPSGIATVENGAIPATRPDSLGGGARLNTFQFAATATVGIDIPVNLSKTQDARYRITPMLTYMLPITPLVGRRRASDPNPFSIGAFQILVALKMNLD